MGWPYKFVDLSDAQKEHRRVLLDGYGLIAQVSAGVVLLAIQLVFLVQWINRSQHKRDQLDAPGSPGQKYAEKSRRRFRAIEQWWRRLSWWTGDSCEIFGENLGTNGQVTAALFWTVWLLVLSFSETGDGMYD